MKGPGLRHDLEIRRLWRCPKCQRELRFLGDVVSLSCNCTDPPVWMQLIQVPKKPAPKFEKIVVPLTEEDLIVRERPPRIPDFLLPPPEGVELDPRDRRNQRRRPRPVRLEDTAEPAVAEPVAPDASGPANPGDDSRVTRREQLPSRAEVPAESSGESAPPEDDFGTGLE